MGNLEGYVEHSFSMDWSKTNVKWYNYDSLLFYMNDEKGKKIWTELRKEGAFWIRINSKKSPISIDWEQYKKNIDKKFHRRNFPFVEKDLLLQKAMIILERKKWKQMN